MASWIYSQTASLTSVMWTASYFWPVRHARPMEFTHMPFGAALSLCVLHLLLLSAVAALKRLQASATPATWTLHSSALEVRLESASPLRLVISAALAHPDCQA